MWHFSIVHRPCLGMEVNPCRSIVVFEEQNQYRSKARGNESDSDRIAASIRAYAGKLVESTFRSASKPSARARSMSPARSDYYNVITSLVCPDPILH
jgi:hypothetical protein